jgi:hypothetical protein
MRDPEHLTDEEIADVEAQIALASRVMSGAKLPKTDKGRRKGEAKSKGRVNPNLLRPGAGVGRDQTWTIRVNPAQRKAVEMLSEELSQPKAKVSIASLMDEAISLLVARYTQGDAEP